MIVLRGKCMNRTGLDRRVAILPKARTGTLGGQYHNTFERSRAAPAMSSQAHQRAEELELEEMNTRD